MNAKDNNPNSLIDAISVVAQGAGLDIGRDALTAALGLAWSAMAVPSEPDLGNWSMYARDAFLVEAGRLFGLEVRAIHPPEAARGLRGTAEFAQHFDASYRPLIHRALEHGQPVLAWQGWPGAHPLAWGVISETCADGVGFRGTVRRSHEHVASNAALVTLHAPPVQLYVVEKITPAPFDVGEAVAVALDHARTALDNGLTGRFGVVTGPLAFDEWAKRLTGAPIGSAPLPEWWAGHRALARASIEGYESIGRFLQAAPAYAGQSVGPSPSALAEACRNVAELLRETTKVRAIDGPASFPDRDAIMATLRQAGTMTERLRKSLPR